MRFLERLFNWINRQRFKNVSIQEVSKFSEKKKQLYLLAKIDEALIEFENGGELIGQN